MIQEVSGGPGVVRLQTLQGLGDLLLSHVSACSSLLSFSLILGSGRPAFPLVPRASVPSQFLLQSLCKAPLTLMCVFNLSQSAASFPQPVHYLLSSITWNEWLCGSFLILLSISLSAALNTVQILLSSWNSPLPASVTHLFFSSLSGYSSGHFRLFPFYPILELQATPIVVLILFFFFFFSLSPLRFPLASAIYADSPRSIDPQVWSGDE